MSWHTIWSTLSQKCTEKNIRDIPLFTMYCVKNIQRFAEVKRLVAIINRQHASSQPSLASVHAHTNYNTAIHTKQSSNKLAQQNRFEYHLEQRLKYIVYIILSSSSTQLSPWKGGFFQSQTFQQSNSLQI